MFKLASDKDKEDNDVLDFGSKKDVLNTDVLGFPIKLDALTMLVGALAVGGVGIGAYNLWDNWNKQNAQAEEKRKIEQAKQARYLQYLQQQQQIAQQRENLLQRQQQYQQSLPPVQPQQKKARIGYDQQQNTVDYNQYLSVGGPSATPSYIPRKQNSFNINLEGETVGDSGAGAYNNQRPPSMYNSHTPMQMRPPDIGDSNGNRPRFTPGDDIIDNVSDSGPSLIDPNNATADDMLPVQFSRPMVQQNPQQQQQPTQQQKPQQPGQQQQQQGEVDDGEEEEYDYGDDESLSPEALMNSMGNDPAAGGY